MNEKNNCYSLPTVRQNAKAILALEGIEVNEYQEHLADLLTKKEITTGEVVKALDVYSDTGEKLY